MSNPRRRRYAAVALIGPAGRSGPAGAPAARRRRRPRPPRRAADEQRRPADLRGVLERDARPGGRVSQPGAPVGVDELAGAERPAGRRRGAGERLGQIAVGPGEQLHDRAAGALHRGGQVAVGVDQRQHPGGLTVGDHQRADREPGPLTGEQRDGAGEAAAQSAYRIGSGSAKGWVVWMVKTRACRSRDRRSSRPWRALGPGGVHVDVLLAGEPHDLVDDLVGDRSQDAAVFAMPS